jgi:hypothetical protein
MNKSLARMCLRSWMPPDVWLEFDVARTPVT